MEIMTMRFMKLGLALVTVWVVLDTAGFRCFAQRKKHVAIFNFDFNTADQGPIYYAYGDIRNLCRQVSDRLEANLVSLGSYNVVERRQVDRVLQEQYLGLAGRIDPDTAAKVGRVLGVDALIIGSVTLLEFQGLPKNGYDPNWSPKRLQARIVLSFRLVDATTARLHVAQEVVGVSIPNGKEQVGKKPEVAERVIGGVWDALAGRFGSRIPIPINRPTQTATPTSEDFKRVINLAVEDATSRMAQQLEQAESKATNPARASEPIRTGVVGRVLRVKATAVFVSGVDRSQVKVGDRLFVRRFQVERDPETGREVRYSEKIGELEVTEIQEAVVVGTFSGAEPVRIGDTVTSK